MHYFRDTVLFENGLDSEKKKTWEETYMKILKACTLENKGKQLLVKNPPDTARIPDLLRLFPNSKFIFLYRNPFVMFPSIRNFYRSHIMDWGLRDIAIKELEENIFEIYSNLMDRYRRDKHLIPGEQLVEVRFEEFEEQPLAELERIYEHLKLDGFDAAVVNFKNYLHAQKNYQKNKYILSTKEIEKILLHWSEDIRERGYTPEEAI
jgi:hypothetical protein